MASRRTRPRPPVDGSVNTPAQEDEADILSEVGAESDPDTGQMVADEAKVLEVGALDAASVIENRRMQDIVDKKRGNIKGVFFNTDDVLVKYEQMLKYWPANSTVITMKRVSGGSPVTLVIGSQPKSGQELYAAMMAQHGAHDEATYDVKVQDTTTKNFLINGRIMLPDARPPQPPQQGQSPMNPYQPPPYGQPAPQYPQQPYAQPQPYMQPAPQIQQPPQQQAPQPVVQVVPPPQQSFGPDAMMTMMQQMFGMFQNMQQQAQQAVAAAHPVPQQPVMHPVPQQPVMQSLPPPPQTSDPAVMMGWMQQMFGLFQQMQHQLAQRSAPPQSPPVQAPAPAPQPQSDPMAMMGQFFKMFMDMQQAANQTVRQAQPSARGGGPYLGPRPDPQQPYPQQYQPPYAQPARQKTAAEQFRENVTEVRSFAETLQDLGTIFPGQQPPAAAAERDDREEDAPVKVMEVGDHKLVLDNRDGSVRKYETVVANLTPIMKWLGEQREAIQKANTDREQKKQQQLPPGYVEVGPGYVPPPGFVAVPVDQIPQQLPPQQQQAPAAQAPLPPPPAQMPPPISEEPLPQNRTWEAPGGN